MNSKNIKLSKVPKHIAFIIDGNGRWAKKLKKVRSYGHLKGMERLEKIIHRSFDYGIKVVSVFAFSTENWNRPEDEVQYLFKLFKDFAEQKGKSLNEQNVKVTVMGDYLQFPAQVSEAITNLVELTKNNTGNVLNIGFNYGGRNEILRAVNELLQSGAKEVTQEMLEKHLYTSGLPDPDFIVRTSGEQRISNFMLWQGAYSELYFPKVCWPDFNNKQLEKALLEFEKRDRRFGRIENKEKI